MASHFGWTRALLAFLAYYLGVGAIWFLVEVKVTPLAASAVTCLLPFPVLWWPSRLCLKSSRMRSGLVLGAFWCACAVVLDAILWVEPLGVLSGPLRINFSAHYFYLERYFPYIFITYGAVFATPVLYVLLRRRGGRGTPDG